MKLMFICIITITNAGNLSRFLVKHQLNILSPIKGYLGKGLRTFSGYFVQ